MRAILICPFTTVVKEVQVEDNLESWYTALTPEHVYWSVGIVQPVRISDTEDLWLDEEGLFKPSNKSFLFKGVYPDPLFGRALIIGTTPRTGNSRDTNFLLTDVQTRIVWTPFVTRAA